MYKKVFCQSKPFGFFAVLVDVPVVVAKLPNDSGHLLHLNVLSAVTLLGHRPFYNCGFCTSAFVFGCD